MVSQTKYFMRQDPTSHCWCSLYSMWAHLFDVRRQLWKAIRNLHFVKIHTTLTLTQTEYAPWCRVQRRLAKCSRYMSVIGPHIWFAKVGRCEFDIQLGAWCILIANKISTQSPFGGRYIVYPCLWATKCGGKRVFSNDRHYFQTNTHTYFIWCYVHRISHVGSVVILHIPNDTHIHTVHVYSQDALVKLTPPVKYNSSAPINSFPGRPPVAANKRHTIALIISVTPLWSSCQKLAWSTMSECCIDQIVSFSW